MLRVSLFGYAKTTRAIAKELSHVSFYDDKCVKPFKDKEGYFVRPSHEFDAKYSDLEITSPGIPPSHPLIKSAQNLISDYDYFAPKMPFSVWISGTNGKTTTTQMMQHLLQHKGSVAGGNIGTPLASLSTEKNIWILETSSFTLHYTDIAKPNIYVLLPLTPDHLSWHGSMSEYERAKLKPLSMMQEGEIAIVPKKYKDTPTNAHIISYKDDTDLAEYFGIDKEKVKFKGAFLSDALLAMSVSKILFDTLDYEKMNAFIIDPHRQEEFYDTQKRLWVNDTKATNLDASVAALQRYQELSIHLILGGDDKGVDLSQLFKYLQTLHVKSYHIGSNKQKLTALAKQYNILHVECSDLKDAVSKIDSSLDKGEVALLSPAAASLDEFSSYAQRGDLFKEYVNALT